MPKVLSEMPKVARPGRKPLYPYDEWFEKAREATKEGKALELIRGKNKDFESKVKTMRHNLYRQAENHDVDLETVVISQNGNESIAIRNNGKRKAKK